jgi:hypothetical protein
VTGQGRTVTDQSQKCDLARLKNCDRPAPPGNSVIDPSQLVTPEMARLASIDKAGDTAGNRKS